MRFFLFFAMFVSANTYATTIEVNGEIWLQPTTFMGVSYAEINAVCDEFSGSCSGALAGFDLTGWKWASPDDLNELFNYYLGSDRLGPGLSFVVLITSTAILDQEFFADFRPTSSEPLKSASTLGFVAGVPDDSVGFTAIDHYGDVAILFDTGEFAFGIPIGTGGWFKQADIPLPGTLPLVVSALLVMGRVKRRSTAVFAMN